MAMQRRFGKTESSVVEASYRRKQLSKTSRNAFTWIFVNLILAAFFGSELFFGSLSEFLDWRHPVVWYTECSLAIWFTLSFVVDVYYYLKPVLTQSTVILSPGQKTLLGIRPTDSGFHVATTINSVSSTSPAPSTSTPVTVSTPSSGNITPPNRFRFSLNQSISSSSGRNQTLYLSPDLIGSPDTSLRSRHSSPRKSQFSPTECISDLGSLEEYLRQQEEQEERLHRSTSESMSPGRGQGYWSFYRQDYTPPLNVYRIATRSPELSTSRDDDEGGYSSTRVEEIWNKLGVTRSDLDHWTENCRKWICQTVLMRLTNEICSVNETLCRIGCAELQIGTISLSSIRQVAVSKADQVPTLRSIIPYLEASSNQEYLVQRIRELAKGGCMGAYHWNSGGQYRGKPWEQDQIADAQLVMHVFCTYMDSRLPADPRFPDGRIFTGMHFLKTPDKPDSRKVDLCIYQSRLHPPHFKVVIEDEIYDISKGRNNLFHSILFFLHQIKTEHHGMLGRVNLGLSGVNILCIISKK